jgi:hypothetical protein
LDKPVDKLWASGFFRGIACGGNLRANKLTTCATWREKKGDVGFPVPNGADCARMGMDNLYVWVYQYEAPENGNPVRHNSYRTRESVESRGGAILHATGKQVPGYEVTEGLWRPDRNPVA